MSKTVKTKISKNEQYIKELTRLQNQIEAYLPSKLINATDKVLEDIGYSIIFRLLAIEKTLLGAREEKQYDRTRSKANS